MQHPSLSDYLRIRARELNLSHSDIARKTSIARQTWYRLLNSEIEESKLSTLIAISKVLKIELIDLIEKHMKESGTSRSVSKSTH